MPTARGDRLDALARALTTPRSRRVLIRLLSGLAFAGPLSRLGVPEAETKKKGGKGKRKKKGKKGKKPPICAADATGAVPCAAGCAGDPDCPVGHGCVNGSCVAVPVVVPGCAGDPDCPAGQWCVNGSCTPPECALDSDCATGQWCDAGSCVDLPGCVGDPDCPRDHTCVGGACVPISPGCAADEDCLTGQWCDAGSCQPGCNSHTHCGGCQLCDLVVHQCCYFAGNLCDVPATCPES